MDWSERRHHLAGAVGAALLARVIDLGWAFRDKSSRAIRFPPAAASVPFADTFI